MSAVETDRDFYCVRRGLMPRVHGLLYAVPKDELGNLLPVRDWRQIELTMTVLGAIMDESNARHVFFTNGNDRVSAVRSLLVKGKPKSSEKVFTEERIALALRWLIDELRILSWDTSGDEPRLVLREHLWPKYREKPDGKTKRAKEDDRPPIMQPELTVFCAVTPDFPAGVASWPIPAVKGREDSESDLKENRTDSCAPPPVLELRLPRRPFTPEENREKSLGQGIEPGLSRYARSVAELTVGPLGKRLARFLGPAQMESEARQSGAEWRRILSDEAETLAELLEQGERSQGTMPSAKTRAKFLTVRLKQRRAA